MKLQNIFFISLVLLGAGVSGYFLFQAGRSLYNYAALQAQAPASILRWEVKETNGKFPVTAYYSFAANGEVWQGATRLDEPWYLNEPSAIAALKQKTKQSWSVWFNPKSPAQSSLEKNFPLNLIVRSLVCLGVLVYFIFFFMRFGSANNS